jgi:hypothetical protein
VWLEAFEEAKSDLMWQARRAMAYVAYRTDAPDHHAMQKACDDRGGRSLSFGLQACAPVTEQSGLTPEGQALAIYEDVVPSTVEVLVAKGAKIRSNDRYKVQKWLENIGIPTAPATKGAGGAEGIQRDGARKGREDDGQDGGILRAAVRGCNERTVRRSAPRTAPEPHPSFAEVVIDRTSGPRIQITGHRARVPRPAASTTTAPAPPATA